MCVPGGGHVHPRGSLSPSQCTQPHEDPQLSPNLRVEEEGDGVVGKDIKQAFVEEGGGDAERADAEVLISAAFALIAAFCLLIFVCGVKFALLELFPCYVLLNKVVGVMYLV